ncbi:hypothetical protein [Mesoaciditoga sp.]
MVKIVFVLLGIVSYVYTGVRILKMRVKFTAFVYFLLLSVFALAVVFDNTIFILSWSSFSLLISALIYILAR